MPGPDDNDREVAGSGQRSAAEPGLLPGDAERLQRNNGCLVLRLPENPDLSRTRALLHAAVMAVARDAPRILILDFTATCLLDHQVVREIEEAARVVGVLGVATSLTGLHPSLCCALVDLGLNFSGIEKVSSLDAALGARGLPDGCTP